MKSGRNYFREINIELMKRGLELINKDRQRCQVNHEFRKVQKFLGKQFREFWKQLLEKIGTELQQAEVEGRNLEMTERVSKRRIKKGYGNSYEVLEGLVIKIKVK